MRSIGTGLITPFRFSRMTGHWKSSLSEAALTMNRSPLPWYTYPSIDFLSQRNFDGRHVLEFGGGQSTLWWAARAASVLTIEEDPAWYARIKDSSPENVALHCVPADTKTRSIADVLAVIDAAPIAKFDLIVIDGHLRKELTAIAFDYLAPGGALILDNAEGYGFYEVVASRDCRRIDFFGFAPGVHLRHCTSLVFVNDCFMLRPEIPIANIEAQASPASSNS